MSYIGDLIIPILRQVYIKTKENSLSWQVSADKDILVASLSEEYIIELNKKISGFNMTKGSESLLNFNLGSLTTSDVVNITGYNNNWQYFLNDFWTMAYFNAKKVNTELDKIKKILDEI